MRRAALALVTFSFCVGCDNSQEPAEQEAKEKKQRLSEAYKSFHGQYMTSWEDECDKSPLKEGDQVCLRGFEDLTLFRIIDIKDGEARCVSTQDNKYIILNRYPVKALRRKPVMVLYYIKKNDQTKITKDEANNIIEQMAQK